MIIKRNRTFNLCIILLLIAALLMTGVGCKKKDSLDIPTNTEKPTEETSDPVASPHNPADNSSDSSNTDIANETPDNSDTTPNINEYVYEPEEIIPVWTFSVDTDIPTWSNPMPFINPMGGEDKYSEIEFTEKEYYHYYYWDEQNVEQSRYVYGDEWILKIPFDETKSEEENIQFLSDFEMYSADSGSTIMGPYGNDIIIRSTDVDDIHWWTEVSIWREEIILTIIKEDEIKVGETLIINTADYEDNAAYFSSYNPGNEYQSIYMEYDAGEVALDINIENLTGEYRRRYRTYESVYEEIGTEFYFDSIMYDPGYSNWEISWNDSSITQQITVTLMKTGEIAEIKYGEPLGAIKVSSEFVSGIDAFPEGYDGVDIDHPEFTTDDRYLDQTPDGDFIMFVPAGYWSVKIYPKGSPLINNYETLMVPVNSGEMTEVEVPYTISSSMKAGNEDYNARGLRIGGVSEINSEDEVSVIFTLLDRDTKDILPDLTNTIAAEGGRPVDLVSVKRVETPPSVVLLLDSSGSMRGNMESTLEAAESFINGLPENTKIQIIDFDDKPQKLEGTTKERAISNLSLIKVNGNTALYESIGMGIDLLIGEDRPTLVAFTDGENDYRFDGGLSLEETIDLVTDSEIPVFTIGFGSGHDAVTMEKLADVPGGQYFNAEDSEALEQVFAAINERLGSTFEAIYTRPKEASIGDVPVVSFVIDTSGSMYNEDEDYGNRMSNVKNLIRQFVLNLPEEVQMQLTEFDDDIKVVQTVTTDKLKILRGLGRLEARGGTDIVGSVEASYRTLKEVPSTKKVLIYITDAALGTTDSDNDYFLELLEDMKKDEINVLWVGLGITEDDDFALAAELTDGEYVVTDDIEVLSESFASVLKNVEESPDSGLSNLFIGVEKITELGERESYSTSKLVELSPIEKSEEVVSSETIKYTTGKIARQYDSETAEIISGESLPVEETTIVKRMDANIESENAAAKVSAEELIFMSKLRGVNAPSGFRFMAVVMDIENVLEAQEVTVYPDGSSHPASWVGGANQGETKIMKMPYMIPDYASHFSVSYNNEGSYPASSATWLVEKPIVYPGNSSITIMPDETVEGALVFLVPDTPMNQLSLHFYDTNYGHIDVPLVGVMKVEKFEIEALPKETPVKLSETFELEITGTEIIEKIPGTGKEVIERDEDKGIVANTGSVLKVVEGNFTSSMQALININPLERFSLKLNTDSGSFYIPVNAATNLIPSGFINPRMISPGSNNTVRWLFEVPEGLIDNESEIALDLYEEDKSVKISNGSRLADGMDDNYQSEFIDLTINNLVMVDDTLMDHYGKFIIADITIHDKKDEYASIGIASMFAAVTDAYFEESDSEEPEVDFSEGGLGNFAKGIGSSTESTGIADLTEEKILGYTDESIVYDGTSRRGILIFDVPDNDADKWYLYSEIFEGLKLEVENGTYDNGLLGDKLELDLDYSFAEALSEAIAAVIEAYKIVHPENSEQLNNGNISLGEEAVDKQNIPAPMISLYGSQKIDEIDSVEMMITMMKGLRYIPSSGRKGPFEFNLSKEALVTQNFGTEQDMANMVVEILAGLGYRPKLKIVKLTEKGSVELAKMSGVTDIGIEELPAVSYVDDNNDYHVLVIPFMEDLDVLNRLVVLENTGYVERVANHASIEINAIGYYIGEGANEQLSDITDALGGDTEGEPTLVSEGLFDEYISMDTLSLDAIDIGIAKNGSRAGVFLITAEGEIMGEEYIDLKNLDVKELEIVIDLPEKADITHIVRIDESMGIEDIFITLGVNLPDLPDDSGEALQKKAEEVYQKADKPSELSALRWYGRSILGKFITSQTIHEEELAAQLDLIIGRTENLRVIAVTQKAGEKLQTSINLLVVKNDIHEGEEQAIQSFNILSGIYASQIEGEALPGEANGIEEIWALAPEGTGIVLLDSNLDTEAIKDLEEAGVPEEIIVHLEKSSKMILIPDNPSVINGQNRWAWYEIDEYTYEMISVIDTFENGAFVESTLMDIVTSAGQHVVGAFKGIETSVWAVAVFSLETDDYKEILKKAKKLALGVAENFGFNAGPIGAGIGGTPSASQSFGGVKASFNGKGSIGQNVLGFTDGFKAGVEYYFSKAN